MSLPIKQMLEQFPEEDIWGLWFTLSKIVAEKYLDQFENYKFKTEYGYVYFTITRETEYPDVFVEIGEKNE